MQYINTEILSRRLRLSFVLGGLLVALVACESDSGKSIGGDDAATGSTTEGALTLGATTGTATEGMATEGTATEGIATEGTVSAGTVTEGTATEGTATEGFTTEGTATEGVTPPIDPTPIVRAPADAQVLPGEVLPLTASVTYTGQPIDIPVTQWLKLSGPGNVVFANANSVSSSASFDQAGSYVLQISVANGPHVGADTMQVTVANTVVNQAPEVNAGPDEVIPINEVLNLSAQVTDDGLPNDTLNGSWSSSSGPGTVTFGETSATNTTATFSATGDYELQYEISDGELAASDTLSVGVDAAPVVGGNGNNVNASNTWQTVSTANGSTAQARHEAAALAYNGKLYMLGGRGNRQVNRYDPATNRWENLGTPAIEMSHFQPVIYDNKIFVIGALDCCYPSESVIAKVQIFNPATKQWSDGATMPLNRRRGSAGVAVYNNKIYIVGGTTNGHDGGMVDWFDEYNPATNTWKTLPDAPSKRDHFSAAMVGNKLVAAGGRRTDYPATFQNLVSTVDIYNFATGQWSSGQAIPTSRAGAMTVSQGQEVILIGGEIAQGSTTLKSVDAYNVNTNSWRQLKPLNTGRHSGGAAIVNGAIHVVSGNLTTGGGAETDIHEKLNIN